MKLKDSGLGWAGAIPAHWTVLPLRRVARLESGHTPSRQTPEYWVPGECTIPWVSLADVWQLRDARQTYLGDTSEKISPLGVQNSAARVLPAGTVVLSRTASVGFAGIMPQPMATTQDFANWVPGPRLVPEFLVQVFRTMAPEFERLRMGSTHQTIYMPDIQAFRIPLPPVDEQRAIVSFVERRTAAIDQLIDKKERMVALLEEKRHAVITEATTKGLDPRVRLKDSGSHWITKIPVHWTVKPLMFLTPPDRPIMYGIVLPGPDVPVGVSIVKAGNVAPGRLRPELLKRTTHEIEERFARARLAANDVVFAIRGSVGSAELVPPEVAGANITQDVARVAPGDGVHPRWLLSVLRSAPTQAQAAAFTTGAIVKGLNIGELKRVLVAVPPLAEQRAISGHIDAVVGALDEALLRLGRTLELLREYRHTLVTAAVTGKIDVMKPVGAA